MNSQLFLVLNVILAVVFLLWFRSGRKSGSSKSSDMASSFDLKKGEGVSSEDFRQQLKKRREQKDYQPAVVMTLLEEEKNPTQSSVKDLNVMFNYNGHSFDAHEVLGVPAGSSLPAVTAKYQEMIIKSDKSSYEFLETAYKAIMQRKSS